MAQDSGKTLQQIRDLLEGEINVASPSDSLLNLSVVASGELEGSISALQMPSVDCKIVVFKARKDNLGSVFIGGSNVTKPDGVTDATSGFELAASEQSPWFPVTNLNLFYRICDNIEDDLTYLALA